MAVSPTVVVGGGPGGSLTALALMRHTSGDVVVVDPSDRPGPGLAFGTDDPRHVVNTPAGTMSVDREDPDDFVRWSRDRGDSLVGADFPPRRRYGDYLEARLGDAASRHPGRLTFVRAKVSSIERDTCTAAGLAGLTLSDGRSLRSGPVVLAIGNAPPAFPPRVAAVVADSPHYVGDPWRPGALDLVASTARVLLLGTGHTAVDVALSLAGRGQRGPIIALSRHGLLPLRHAATGPAAVAGRAGSDGPARLRAIVHNVVRDARATDWQSVVDDVRPRANAVWSQLSLDDRQRFLAHVAPYWEVHRHRLAPEAADRIERLLADGALTVHKGRLMALAPAGDGFVVQADLAQAPSTRWSVDVVVNCTGPGHPAGHPLVRTLVADGLARADALHLGVEVDADGRLVCRDGHATPGLFVVGGLRRGAWWETTDIPDLRTQGDQVAAAIAGIVDLSPQPANVTSGRTPSANA